MAGRPGHPAGLGRRAPDQRRHRDPSRRSGVWLSVHRRRAPRPGTFASRNRLNRLCTQQRLGSVHVKKRGPTPKPGPPVHDDLVERSFTAVRLDQLWLTDITEHPSAEGKLYLCAIKDARSRRIVGSSMSERMTAKRPSTPSTMPSSVGARSHRGALRPRQPVPVQRLRPNSGTPPTHWVVAAAGSRSLAQVGSGSERAPQRAGTWMPECSRPSSSHSNGDPGGANTAASRRDRRIR
jgi:hypothetical protein